MLSDAQAKKQKTAKDERQNNCQKNPFYVRPVQVLISERKSHSTYRNQNDQPKIPVHKNRCQGKSNFSGCFVKIKPLNRIPADNPGKEGVKKSPDHVQGKEFF